MVGNPEEASSVDKCLVHMYGTLGTCFCSFSIIYFYGFQFQLDFISLMAWDMLMDNNNLELTFQGYLLFDWFS